MDLSSLEPQIHAILTAPGTDLTTISAKRVRKQLQEQDPRLTSEFVKENKGDIDARIARIFEEVSADRQSQSSSAQEDSDSRKRKQSEISDGSEEGSAYERDHSPPPKKAKSRKNGTEQSDAALARQLSNEINGRTSRRSGKSQPKHGRSPRKKKTGKSAAIISDEDDSDGTPQKTRSKDKSSGRGAKGGFAKEFNLSAPLATVLNVDKLSRPQVVKQLWVYIKDKDLQNPDNKREIMCDTGLKAVFNADKIDMFKMNKVLGQHLHEPDE